MIGTQLGDYLLEERIGAGGMGVVYKARDLQLEREVAIKILNRRDLSEPTEPPAHEQILHEARIASALNHPNICTVYTVGETEEHNYIAMEFIKGRPLSERIPLDGLPINEVLVYGTQIADAISHAHEQGIAHRDLKSSNVIITPEGRVKILDFGIARLFPVGEKGETFTRASITGSEEVQGTLGYMAPEILQGKPATPRSDVWSLGVLLYEMAVGELPYAGTTQIDIASSILKDPFPNLPTRIPPGVRSIIQGCTTRDPDQRYQRAGEIRAGLSALGTDVGASLRSFDCNRFLSLAASGLKM